MRRLRPVENRFPWITGGLVLEVIGAAVPAIYMFTKAKHESVGGSITRATIKLVWHQSLHSHTGLAILIGGAVAFAAGAVLLARPYATNVIVLIVGVPVAAIAGLLVLGIFALVIAFLVATAEGLDGGGDWGWWLDGWEPRSPRSKKKRAEKDQAAYQASLRRR